MSLTMTVEIPALDRLCGILEGWQRAGLCREIEDEIVGKLKEAAEGGVPKPKFEEVPAGDDHPWKDEAAQKAQEGPKEPPKAEPTNVTPMPAAPAPAPKAERPSEARAEGASAAKQDAPETRGQANGAARGATATLADVQKAAAQMRDEGRLNQVTGMFAEFNIKKLSDLKGDALQKFAERLRGLGARI